MGLKGANQLPTHTVKCACVESRPNSLPWTRSYLIPIGFCDIWNKTCIYMVSSSHAAQWIDLPEKGYDIRRHLLFSIIHICKVILSLLRKCFKIDKFSFYLNLVAASRNCQANRCRSIRNLSSKSQIVLFFWGNAIKPDSVAVFKSSHKAVRTTINSTTTKIHREEKS